MMIDTVSGEEIHGPQGTVLLPPEKLVYGLWWINPLYYLNVLKYIYTQGEGAKTLKCS